MNKKTLIVLLAFLCLPVLMFAETVAPGSDKANEINAAVIYKASIDSLKNIPSNFITRVKTVVVNGWLPEHNDLRLILKQNQISINKFKQASNLTYCDFAFGKTVERTATSESLLPSNILTPVRLVLLEARLYELENKWDLALKDYISILKFSNQLSQQENEVIVFKIVEIIAQNLVYLPLTQYIDRKEFTLQECNNLQNVLILMKNKRTGLEKVFVDENKLAKNNIRELGEGAKRQGKYDEGFYSALYNEFDRLSDEFDKYLIEAAQRNRPLIYEEKINAFNNEVKKEPLKLSADVLKSLTGLSSEIKSSAPAYIAKMLFSIGGAPALKTKIITKYYVALAKFNILLTGVAVKSFEIKNHKLPGSLVELIPGYLSELPVDPFNDFTPLKFEKKDKSLVIYSLGPDKKDDSAAVIYNGKEEGLDFMGAGDIVLSLDLYT